LFAPSKAALDAKGRAAKERQLSPNLRRGAMYWRIILCAAKAHNPLK